MSKIKLGDITKIRTGKLDANASSENGKYPFFTCSKDPLRIDSYSYDCECVLVAGNGDLNVKYYKGKFDAYQRTYIIEDNSSGRLYMPYLYYYLDLYVEELRKQSIGGVIKYIKLGNLTDAIIDLPSIETQKETIKILDKSRKILENKNLQLQEYDQLIKSRFVEIFEDEIKETRLEDVCLGITDGSHNPPKGVDYSENVMLSSQNINDRQISLDNPRYLSDEDYQKENRRTQIKTGDVLLTIVGSIGRTAVVHKDFGKLTLQRSVAVLHPNFSKVTSTYLEQALVYIRYIIESKSNGVAQKGIYLKQVRNLMIKLPPLETQKKYEDFIQQVDKLKFEVQKSLDETQMLFDSLMQEYFG